MLDRAQSGTRIGVSDFLIADRIESDRSVTRSSLPSWSEGSTTIAVRSGRYTQADPIGLAAGVNLYGYVEENPTTLTDRLGLISQRELDEMDCCQLANAIREARRELLRLRNNQNDPVKRAAPSAFKYVSNYVGHRISWINWSNRLRDLIREFDHKDCKPELLPPGVRKLGDDRYPDFPWDEFMNQYREGANETMNQINQIMNDPRTWIFILQGAAGGAGAPAGARP